MKKKATKVKKEEVSKKVAPKKEVAKKEPTISPIEKSFSEYCNAERLIDSDGLIKFCADMGTDPMKDVKPIISLKYMCSSGGVRLSNLAALPTMSTKQEYHISEINIIRTCKLA
jgi:hypothetical protein